MKKIISGVAALFLGFTVTAVLTPDPAEAQRRGGGGGGHARGGAHQSIGGGGGNRSAARSAGTHRTAGANRGSVDRTAGANRGNFDGANRGAGDRTNVNRGGDRTNIDRGDRNVDRNTNRNTNIGSNNNINIDVDDGWGGGDWDYHPIAAGVAFGTAAAVTSAAIGSMYYSLPAGCPPYPYGGYTYYNCNNVWYQPQYSGSSVNYVVINDPTG